MSANARLFVPGAARARATASSPRRRASGEVAGHERDVAEQHGRPGGQRRRGGRLAPLGGTGQQVAHTAAVSRRPRQPGQQINVDEGDVDAQRFYERHGVAATDPASDERAFYYAREL